MQFNSIQLLRLRWKMELSVGQKVHSMTIWRNKIRQEAEDLQHRKGMGNSWNLITSKQSHSNWWTFQSPSLTMGIVYFTIYILGAAHVLDGSLGQRVDLGGLTSGWSSFLSVVEPVSQTACLGYSIGWASKMQDTWITYIFQLEMPTKKFLETLYKRPSK